MRLLKIREPEGLVPAVVELRDVGRTADRISFVIFTETGLLLPLSLRGEVLSVECFVLNVPVTRAVQIVCAGLDGEVGDRRLATVILRADRAGLKLELADGFGGRTELVVVAA